MRYEGTLYRPPSEARSLIIQATIGCAWNQCTFCSMYKDKQFRIRKEADILKDLQEAARYAPDTGRLFLADGDAMVLPADQLVRICEEAKRLFPKLHRISAYATARDIIMKSPEELQAIYDAGLSLLYIGLESGAPEVLKDIKKDFTADAFVAACRKAKEAGFRLSVTLIAGLSDQADTAAHATATAEVISAVKSNYASYLTLYLEPGAPLYDDLEAGHFALQTPAETLEEIRVFLSHVDADGCVFRSNHPSNYVSLAGTLNRDRARLIETIDHALKDARFRPENWRAL